MNFQAVECYPHQLKKMEDAGNKTIQQFNLSIDLLREAQEYLEATLLN